MRKVAKRGEKIGKGPIRYGKSAYDIIKFNYFIGIRIWQWFVIKMTMPLKTVFVNKSFGSSTNRVLSVMLYNWYLKYICTFMTRLF